MEEYLNINLLWASACLLFLVISLASNASGAPGNWIMFFITGVYAWLMPSHSPYDVGLSVIGVVLVLAITGEILEFYTPLF